MSIQSGYLHYLKIMWSKCLYNRIIEIWWNAITHPRQFTLPKTNIAPENRPGRKKKFIFRTIHFQMGAVSFLGRVYFLKVSIFLRSHPHTPGRYHRIFHHQLKWRNVFLKEGEAKGVSSQGLGLRKIMLPIFHRQWRSFHPKALSLCRSSSSRRLLSRSWRRPLPPRFRRVPGSC